MKFKAVISSVIFLLTIATASAQRHVSIFLHTLSIDSTSSGDHYWVFKQAPSPISNTDTVKTSSSLNQLQSLSKYVSQGVADGVYTLYYDNGTMKEKGRYQNGRKVGMFVAYYPNGKIRMMRQYPGKSGTVSEWPDLDFKILSYNDAAGNMLVANGNGFCVCEFDEGNISRGKVRNGLRDSLWLEERNGSLVFKEVYKGGKLLSGKRYVDGDSVTYNKFEMLPQYVYGDTAMYKTIMHKIKYPPTARDRSIQGTVFVGFTVNEDGSVSDVGILKKADPWLDQEAIRAIKLAEAWKPGMQRGEKKKVKFVFGVTFSIK